MSCHLEPSERRKRDSSVARFCHTRRQLQRVVLLRIRCPSPWILHRALAHTYRRTSGVHAVAYLLPLCLDDWATKPQPISDSIPGKIITDNGRVRVLHRRNYKTRCSVKALASRMKGRAASSYEFLRHVLWLTRLEHKFDVQPNL